MSAAAVPKSGRRREVVCYIGAARALRGTATMPSGALAGALSLMGRTVRPEPRRGTTPAWWAA
ncbi:hypothetical protein [Yimella lutea]|uniref:hypothetical protein n=1 Tax=Yimella lutea TaxID=587872 RepID=UPI0014770123|nr:hypothetical protein [Yimella lutea]